MLTLPRSMTDTVSERLLPAAEQSIPLLRNSFGPWPHCQALIWEQLVDFRSWARWMPGVRAVHRLDSGPVGRGSRLQIERSFRTDIWEIIHWHCHHRLDFEIASSHCRAGFSVRLAPGIDADHAAIRLDGEFESTTAQRLLAYFSQRRLEKSSIEWLNGFSDYFLSQKPPAD